MTISKEFRIDLDILESIISEGDSGGVPAYVNTEIGEVLPVLCTPNELMGD